MTKKRESHRAESMLVKRYAGRHLYNTATLSYVTPDTLRAMSAKDSI